MTKAQKMSKQQQAAYADLYDHASDYGDPLYPCDNRHQECAISERGPCSGEIREYLRIGRTFQMALKGIL